MPAFPISVSVDADDDDGGGGEGGTEVTDADFRKSPGLKIGSPDWWLEFRMDKETKYRINNNFERNKTFQVK